MPKRTVRTDQAPPAIGPYSQATVGEGLIFVSGQIGIDPSTGELALGGIEAETEQALRNIGAVLAAEGLDLNDVLRTTVFLVDMNDFAVMNSVYGRYFKQPFPARSTVGVGALPKGARVEIEAVAMARQE